LCTKKRPLSSSDAWQTNYKFSKILEQTSAGKYFLYEEALNELDGICIDSGKSFKINFVWTELHHGKQTKVVI
jgi:hypothetical protein